METRLARSMMLVESAQCLGNKTFQQGAALFASPLSVSAAEPNAAISPSVSYGKLGLAEFKKMASKLIKTQTTKPRPLNPKAQILKP